MDVEAYIATGVLELYVAGLLSEEENLEVYRYSMEYPEIKLEIVEIESAILALSKTVTPHILKKKGFDNLKVRIGQRKDTTIVQLPKHRTKWSSYLGVTMALLFGLGLLYYYYENTRLTVALENVDKENEVLEQQIFEARNTATTTSSVLQQLRAKEIRIILLKGQKIAPDAYAKVFWNKEEKKIIVDALGMPEPPEGLVYQLWSYELSPTTYKSLGVLDKLKGDYNKIFTLNNSFNSEAFGITLEQEGGSNTPTLTQLYTTGTVPY